MAIPCQGVSITWGTAAFSEVSSFAYNYGGKTVGKDTNEVGRAVVACFGTANTSITNHGTRQTLTATGGGHNLTVSAVWESVQVNANVNGVTTFAVSFRLVED